MNRIPALPHQPPLVETAAPRSQILSGDTSALGKGRWPDLAGSINLLIATGRAQVFWQQWWSDGQFDVAGGAQVNRISIPIPFISPKHTAVVVQIYGETPDTGTVYARATLGAPPDEQSVGLPGAADWVSIDLAVFDGGDDGEYLHLDTEDGCKIYGGVAWIVDYVNTGVYPDDDDELPAEPVGAAIPVDDDEVDDDEALDTGLVQQIRKTQDTVRLRPRQVMALAGLKDTDSRWLCTYPMRQPVLLPLTRSGRVRAKVKALMYSTSSMDEFNLLIDRGNGGIQALLDVGDLGAEHPSVTKLPVVPGSGAQWYEVDITLEPMMPTPPQYAGLAWVGIYTDAAHQGDLDKVIEAVAIIEIPEEEP